MSELSDEDFLKLGRIEAQEVYDGAMLERKTELRALYLERFGRDLRAPAAAEALVGSGGRLFLAVGIYLVGGGVACMGYGLLMDVSVSPAIPSLYGIEQAPVANFDKMAQRELFVIIGAAQLVAGAVSLGVNALMKALSRAARLSALRL